MMMKLTVSICAALSFADAFPTSNSSLVEDLNPSEFVKLLQELHVKAQTDPQSLLSEIASSGLAAIAPVISEPEQNADAPLDALPVVVAHGMGDSCFNPGMKSIATAIQKRLGSPYSTCVPTGNNQITDTINGFLMNMDKSIDVFAAKIKKDPKLAGGFYAAGFSQGNSLISGYILKYNDPPVKAFLSVHGTVNGVSGLPSCNPAGLGGILCKAISKLCGTLAYNSIVQGLLFQADYFRDPMKHSSDAYLKHSQLAALLNEDGAHPEYKDNFAKTGTFAMVKAMKDSMVYPNAGEWWGGFADGGYKAEDMKSLSIYTKDTFGLKTADEAGKISHETTPGDHLQFTEQQLFGWVDKYFK